MRPSMFDITLLGVIALWCGCSGNGMAAGVDAEGQALALACAGCHVGDDVPDLRGMDAERFLTAMRAFQSGQRRAAIMDRLARGYSEAELAAMAAYWQAQQP